MHIADLIAFRKAEAGGYIKFNHAEMENHCPVDKDCFSCPFTIQCDDYSYCTAGDDSVTVGWVRQFQELPEFELSIDELEIQYPEYFI